MPPFHRLSWRHPKTPWTPDSEKASGFAPDRGRLAEFDLNGKLVRVYRDEKHLNAPWGVAIASASFGAFGGAVLVGNFGGCGYVTAFDGATGAFFGYLRGPGGTFVSIPGLWGLQFGNGVNLGDGDALYFAAGPEGGSRRTFRLAALHPRLKAKD